MAEQIYSILDNEAFNGFKETLESTDGILSLNNDNVVLESECAPASMLAESLTEYGILEPLMEAETPANGTQPNQPQTTPKRKTLQNSRVTRQKANAQDNATNGSGNGKTVNTKKTAKQTPEQVAQQKRFATAMTKVKTLLGNMGLNGNKQVISVAQQVLNDPDALNKVEQNEGILKNLLVNIIKRDENLFKEVQASGGFEKIGINLKSDGTMSKAQPNKLQAALSILPSAIEIPDAFQVEPDDSEWDNAVVTGYGFAMVNLTSPLVHDMLRASDPKSQKRAYKEFKKQLKSDPDIANALGMGLGGMLGARGGREVAKDDKSARIKVDSVGTEGAALMEGAISDIKNALSNPVELLKQIAKPRGTACKRNSLVVMHDEIDGKSGDSEESVTVIPIGVSGGTIRKLNMSVSVPVAHLTAFYSLVDPKASFASYAKAMAEVNTKSDNAGKGIGDTLKDAAKGVLSKIPGLGSDAKKEIEAKQASAEQAAMKQLVDYIDREGHPPFYLLKPKSDPKEVDHWADDDAANGYQLITVQVGNHKAGLFLKEKTANALFRVG